MALAGIELALLDVKARALDISVIELFGGPTRDRVRVYWSHCGTTRARNPQLGKPPLRTMADIDRQGIVGVMKKSLRHVGNKTDCVHVSFDLDAVDPGVAPGVGTPVTGGLNFREAHTVMELIADSGLMTSLEMVEVNPILDTRNSSAEFAVELVFSAFGKKIL